VKARYFVPLAVAAAAPWIASASSASPRAEARYIFYLHGAIVEEQGPKGVSPRYGLYDYPGILEAFRRRELRVVSEVRARGTKVSAYADKVAVQVRRLIASGVDPSHITIAGASRGAVIAALVSTRLKQPRVRYVLLANCNPSLIRNYHPRLTGEILSIYERSDEIGGSCDDVVARSPGVTSYKEIALNPGLGHGIVYRPLEQWVGPATQWAKR
jgi:hypothetical protein